MIKTLPFFPSARDVLAWNNPFLLLITSLPHPPAYKNLLVCVTPLLLWASLYFLDGPVPHKFTSNLFCCLVFFSRSLVHLLFLWNAKRNSGSFSTPDPPLHRDGRCTKKHDVQSELQPQSYLPPRSAPLILTLHMNWRLKAPFSDALGHCFCLAPVGPWVFPPHGRDLELWGAAPAWPLGSAISEEAKPELDIGSLWRELGLTGQGHWSSLSGPGGADCQHRL